MAALSAMLADLTARELDRNEDAISARFPSTAHELSDEMKALSFRSSAGVKPTEYGRYLHGQRPSLLTCSRRRTVAWSLSKHF